MHTPSYHADCFLSLSTSTSKWALCRFARDSSKPINTKRCLLFSLLMHSSRCHGNYNDSSNAKLIRRVALLWALRTSHPTLTMHWIESGIGENQLAITNHVDRHFKFYIQSWEVKVIRGQSKEYFSLEVFTHALLAVFMITPTTKANLFGACSPILLKVHKWEAIVCWPYNWTREVGGSMLCGGLSIFDLPLTFLHGSWGL